MIGHRKAAARGATMIELIIGVAILLVAVAAAAAIAITGGQLTRRAALTVEANDASRTALEAIERDLRLAGFGAPGGIWVDGGAGARRINAVFGAGGGTDAADELWLVIPERGVLGPAGDRGSAVAVTRAGTGAVELAGVGEAFSSGDVLMVSNLTTAALVTETVVDDTVVPARLSYREMALPDFSDAPHLGGFQIGDRAFRVEIVRYYVDAGSHALYRATGSLRRQPLGAAFVEDAGSRRLVAADVEDLQIAFGRGEVGTLAYSDSLEPDFVPDLRSVRVSLVARSSHVVRGEDDRPVPFAPMAVEDHRPAADPDGFPRSLYTRRVELSNLDPVNL